MTRWIALLRAVNVGGRRKLVMADLRAHLSALGYGNVATYIQSGNVLLDHDAVDSPTLASELSAAIEQLTGFAVPTMARSADEWHDVTAANPFPTDDPTKVHVLFLDQRDPVEPIATAFDATTLAEYAPERLALRDHDVYLLLPDGMGRSKLVPALSRVNVATTARNWRTVLHLETML